MGVGVVKLFKSSALVPTDNGEISGDSEIARVLALPRREPYETRKIARVYTPETQALVEVMTERFARVRTPGTCACESLGAPCITTLNAAQAWALREFPRQGGGIGWVPIGAGKTGLSILMALAFTGVKKVVLLAKSDQRLHYRQNWLRLREHFRVPSFVISDGGDPMISDETQIVHFLPYSQLSRPESTRLLDELNPELVLADEVHALANLVSARTLRFLRAMSAGSRKFCGWSGTPIDKSVKNASHLLAFGLGSGSPMPINPDEAEAWAAVLDPQVTPDRETPTAKALYRAFAPPREGVVSIDGGLRQLRRGFRKRLIDTPGVIAVRGTSATCSIVIRERKIVMPEMVRKALNQIRAGVRPDGEEITEADEKARYAAEAGAGLYGYWAFPRGEPIEVIDEWFAARQDINRALRQRIMMGEEHMDSRKLCENAAERGWRTPVYEGSLPVWKEPTWPRWAAVMDQVKPDPRVWWISACTACGSLVMPGNRCSGCQKIDPGDKIGEYLAKDAAVWAKENLGIVWTISRALGKRIAQLADIPYYGEGSEAEIMADKGKTSIVASVRAHNEGRDGLQHRYSKQLLAQIPAGGKTLSQLLGRLARQGQKADLVETDGYFHFAEAKEALRKAVRGAEFAEEVSPTESLLKAADITFPF